MGIKAFLIKHREVAFDYFVRMYYAFMAIKTGRKYVALGESHVGIGNRLIALANTYAWHSPENISVVWCLDDWVPVGFEELFIMSNAPGFEVTSCKREKWSRFVQVPGLVFKTTKWWQFWVPPAFAADLDKGNIFCLYNDTPDWAKQIYGEFFKQLKPSEKVLGRIRTVQIPEDVICVQIRNSNVKTDAAGVASVETFINVMKEYGQEQKFYLSCMNTEVSEIVKRHFGDRVLELPNKDYTSMIDAVADMWLLGGGKKLICQRGSSFAEVGWWWRGRQASVRAIKAEYVQTRDRK